MKDVIFSIFNLVKIYYKFIKKYNTLYNTKNTLVQYHNYKHYNYNIYMNDIYMLSINKRPSLHYNIPYFNPYLYPPLPSP
jgi:hypothetical protein